MNTETEARRHGIIAPSLQTAQTDSALVRSSPRLRMVPLRRVVMNGGDKAEAGPDPVE